MKDLIINFFGSNLLISSALVYKLFISLVTIISCFVLSKVISSLVVKTFNKVDNFDNTIIPFVSTSVKILTFTIGLTIILDVFGVNTSSLIALLGTAGLAIGLALKDTLSNVAAGFVLIILRPFKVDHYIEFGSTSGTVREINLLTTILETSDSLFVSAPNSCLWGVPIKNYTKNGKRRLDIVVGISYSDSIDAAFKVFNEIIENESRFLKEPAPQIMVLSMGDSSINIQLRVWLEVSDFWPTQWDLNKTIKEKIEAAGLTIPFPQRELRIIKETLED